MEQASDFHTKLNLQQLFPADDPTATAIQKEYSLCQHPQPKHSSHHSEIIH